MDELTNLLHGFSVALTLPNLLYMLIGITLGVLIGVLPGLGGANGVAILLPLTFSMNPTSAIIMLSCIYWGALFGGAITSVLFNIPGEPWSVATTFDGYPMAQQGKAAQALTAAFTSSFVGALFAVILITFLAPLLARLDYRPRVLCHYHRKFGEFVVPPQADGLIAVSHAVRGALEAAASPTMPVTVLHNPVPDALGVSLPHPAGNRPRLVYGGGRQQNKGFFELEAALGSGLAEQFDVVLCGPGFEGYQPPFPARVAGMLPSDAFLAEMRAADVVAMPSHHEGFSILALEALGLGKLLVATQGGGLGEILDADNALIHPAGDATALAGCLRQALALLSPEGEAAGKRMRDAASRTVARFSAAAINRQLAAIYRQYLGMMPKEPV